MSHHVEPARPHAGSLWHTTREPAISYFLLKRFGTFLATLLVASAVIFVVLDILPGNAAEVMLGDTATPETLKALVHQARPGPAAAHALRPVAARGMATADLGNSVSYDTPITELITQRLAVTVPLAVLAMLLTTVIALSLGLYAASRHNKLGDRGRDGGEPARHRGAQFLVCDRADPGVLGEAAVVLGRWLHRLG